MKLKNNLKCPVKLFILDQKILFILHCHILNLMVVFQF